MKKMKRKNVVLLWILGVLVFIIGGIVLLSNWDAITLKKYEYRESGIFNSGIIIMEDGVLYEEISEFQYENLMAYAQVNNLNYSGNAKVGKLDSVYFSNDLQKHTQKYRILGNENLESRVLLKCDNLHKTFDVSLPIMYFCRRDVLYSSLSLTEYVYLSEGTTIEGDGVVYKEVDEETFLRIYDEFWERYQFAFSSSVVGRINYNNADEWDLTIYGRQEQEDRILLIGREEQAFYDEDYPEIFFCREDIFNLFKEHGSFDGIDLSEYME